MKHPFRSVPMTPSYERIRERFQSFMIGDETADVGHLVLALLCEESLGGKCLSDIGITIAGIADGCFGPRAADTAMLLVEEGNNAVPAVLSIQSQTDTHRRFDEATWFQRIHERAGFIARRSSVSTELSTEHLVQAMIEVSGPARTQLAEAGVDEEALLAGLLVDDTSVEGLEVDFQLSIEPVHEQAGRPTSSDRPSISIDGNISSATSGILALLDANLNRAREGLRVLEDYARFVCRDPATTEDLKNLRHNLVATELAFRSGNPLLKTARNIQADVGTSITTSGESAREQISDVVTANARRIQESLRSLEEFGKTLSSEFAAHVKQLRYRSYDVEQRLMAGFDNPASGAAAAEPGALRVSRLARLAKARLYVLLSESECTLPWKEVVTQALKGGADVIQLREKWLSEAELISRSQWIADACESYDALFILNDRADLAVTCGAHGVHLGQDDLETDAARSVLSPDQLVGVSTHDIEQVRLACDLGADYLGVGPVFASQTKSFSDFPGLPFVQQASAHAVRPWFAIGGIGLENINEVVDAGATRVAVCGAVVATAHPQASAEELRAKILNPDLCDTVRFPRP